MHQCVGVIPQVLRCLAGLPFQSSYVCFIYDVHGFYLYHHLRSGSLFSFFLVTEYLFSFIAYFEHDCPIY